MPDITKNLLRFCYQVVNNFCQVFLGNRTKTGLLSFLRLYSDLARSARIYPLIRWDFHPELFPNSTLGYLLLARLKTVVKIPKLPTPKNHQNQSKIEARKNTSRPQTQKRRLDKFLDPLREAGIFNFCAWGSAKKGRVYNIYRGLA